MNTSPEVIESQSNGFKSHFTEVTTFSKLAAAVIFIVLPFLGFYLGTMYNEQVVVIDQAVPQVQETKPSSLEYKKLTLGIEVPRFWSVYSTSDISIIDTWPVEDALQKHVFTSVSASEIFFYDWNANQIDIYLLSNKAGSEYQSVVAEMAKNNPKMLIEEKMVGDRLAKVITWYADDSVPGKGSGDSQNVLIPASTSADTKYILINKQSKGDESFEKAYTHLLETIQPSQF